MGDLIAAYLIRLVGYAALALLGVTALGFLIAAIYMALTYVLTPAGAAAATGGAVLLIAGFILVMTGRMSQRDTRRTEVSSTETAEQLGAAMSTGVAAWLSERARVAVPAALVSGFIAGFSPKARRSLIRALSDVIATLRGRPRDDLR
jgi:apolipoprotein N-acyltransferase